MMISIGGTFPLRVISDYIQYGLKEKLQTIPGVGEISLMGVQTRNVRIWLNASSSTKKD